MSYKELKEINAGIIQLHVSGYGSWGPWTGRTSYDVIAQSMGGLSAITGFEDRGPIKSGVWIANWITGLMCAITILTALNYRERTGQGQFIDYLQAENVIRWLDWTWLYAYKTGEDRKRSGNRDLAICPSDLFDCKDGWVAIAAFRVKEFHGLCMAMNRPDLYEAYADPLERLKDENATALLETIAEWTQTKQVEEVEALASRRTDLQPPGCWKPGTPTTVNISERGAIQEYQDSLYGHMVQHCYPPRLSETPSRLKWSCRPLGFDNAYVLTKILDLSSEEVQELEQEGVVFKGRRTIPSRK